MNQAHSPLLWRKSITDTTQTHRRSHFKHQSERVNASSNLQKPSPCVYFYVQTCIAGSGFSRPLDATILNGTRGEYNHKQTALMRSVDTIGGATGCVLPSVHTYQKEALDCVNPPLHASYVSIGGEIQVKTLHARSKETLGLFNKPKRSFLKNEPSALFATPPVAKGGRHSYRSLPSINTRP